VAAQQSNEYMYT
jgi:hypothetical protein